MSKSDPAADVRVAFAERLAIVRKAYGQRSGRPGLDAKDFAAELGLEPERYRKYERGEREAPYWVLVRIHKSTGFSLDFLLAGDPVGRAA